MRCGGRSEVILLFGGYVRILNALDFLVRCKIHDRKSIKLTTHLSEDPLGGAVGIRRDRHRRGGWTHGKRPSNLVGPCVNHAHHVPYWYGRSADPTNRVLAVRGDVQVVYAAPDRDGLDVLKRARVNHVDAAARSRPNLRKMG